MLISFIDIFLIASGIAGWLAIGALWMWRLNHDKAHAQPHAPTLDELEARAAVATAKAAEARRAQFDAQRERSTPPALLASGEALSDGQRTSGLKGEPSPFR